VCENGPWLHTLTPRELDVVERILQRRGRVNVYVSRYDPESAYYYCIGYGEEGGEEEWEDESWAEAMVEAGSDCAAEVHDGESDVIVIHREGGHIVLEGGRVRYSFIRDRGGRGDCEEIQPLPEGKELCIRSMNIPRREFDSLRELVEFFEGLYREVRPADENTSMAGRDDTQGIVGRLVTEASLPPYDRWLREERCPVCDAVPVIVSYVSGDMGLDVVLRCPRCGFTWGINDS